MVPLYAARVADLGPDDRVKIECVCGHVAMLTPAMLGTAGVPSHVKLLDLKHRLKCRSCRWRGRADVSIHWGKPAVL
jgi:hypothetical protein